MHNVIVNPRKLIHSLVYIYFKRGLPLFLALLYTFFLFVFPIMNSVKNELNRFFQYFNLSFFAMNIKLNAAPVRFSLIGLKFNADRLIALNWIVGLAKTIEYRRVFYTETIIGWYLLFPITLQPTLFQMLRFIVVNMLKLNNAQKCMINIRK